MHDKFERKMLKAHEREDVYIVEKIAKGLNEFALFLVMHHNFISLMNINTAFLNVNISNSLMNVANELVIVNEVNYS